jgi:hypothetical protein
VAGLGWWIWMMNHPNVSAVVLPLREPSVKACPTLLARQMGASSDARQIERERQTCQDGHGKAWFSAAVTAHRQDTTADCHVVAFDQAGDQLFNTFLPVEELDYPAGPEFQAGHTRRFIGFFLDFPARPVYHYQTHCEPGASPVS